MKFSIFDISTFDTFSVYLESATMFEHLLAAGLYGFHSDMVEDWSMSMICVSQEMREDMKPTRVKYYADRILTNNASVTPKVHVFKLLDMNFFVDYDKRAKAQTEEECLRVLCPGVHAMHRDHDLPRGVAEDLRPQGVRAMRAGHPHGAWVAGGSVATCRDTSHGNEEHA